jgi:molybdopterin-binding protein
MKLSAQCLSCPGRVQRAPLRERTRAGTQGPHTPSRAPGSRIFAPPGQARRRLSGTRCLSVARNQLKGKIVDVVKGATTSHVRIDIGSGVVVTSSITNEAVADLDLKPGDDAWAVIKASDVMIGK